MQDIVETAKRTGFDFLAVDLDLAMTFFDTAEASTDPETQVRNVSNAAKAYDTVRDLAGRVNLPLEQSRILEEKLSLLKSRLDAGLVRSLQE